MSDHYEPTPEDIAKLRELEQIPRNYHERTRYYDQLRWLEREERWKEENAIWLGDHMELWDADED